MSVNPLKIQEDMHTDETSGNNANTPLAKQDMTINQGIASTSSNASFDLVMSQLGIADRHAFNAYQAKLWQEAVIERQQLTVLTCEVDYYQEYLQHHGQQGASFMMVSVVLALKNVCMQTKGYLAYFGQNRLTVLIKGGDQNSVQGIAENLCLAVKNTATEHKYSKVDNIVTISIGFSTAHPNSMQTLENQAKNALKNAKILGRNKVSHSHNKNHHQQIQEMIKKRHALLKEKQQKLAPKQDMPAPKKTNYDLFADPLKNEAKKSQAHTKMYRGQPVLEPDLSTASESKSKTTSTKEKSKKSLYSGKMYRGQMITN